MSTFSVTTIPPATSTPQPQDGPATTTFLADPHVTSIYNQETDFWDLVLVAGFPLITTRNHIEGYEEFVQLIKYSCFEPSDVEGHRPAVWLYQPQYLHVTIATLQPLHRRRPHDETTNYIAMRRDYNDLIQRAQKSPSWPTQPLQLQLEKAQIGSKAGIFLWKDVSGSVQGMREALRQASSSSTPIHSIPNIIHSTFLRFAQVPQSRSAAQIQQEFSATVLPALPRLFPQPVVTGTIQLVCETTPYMHMEKTPESVVLSLEL